MTFAWLAFCVTVMLALLPVVYTIRRKRQQLRPTAKWEEALNKQPWARTSRAYISSLSDAQRELLWMWTKCPSMFREAVELDAKTDRMADNHSPLAVSTLALVDQMDDIFRHAPVLKQPLRVNRCIRGVTRDNFRKSLPYWLSTTVKEPDVNVLQQDALQIRGMVVPRGTPVLFLVDVSQFPDEAEVLLPRNVSIDLGDDATGAIPRITYTPLPNAPLPLLSPSSHDLPEINNTTVFHHATAAHSDVLISQLVRPSLLISYLLNFILNMFRTKEVNHALVCSPDDIKYVIRSIRIGLTRRYGWGVMQHQHEFSKRQSEYFILYIQSLAIYHLIDIGTELSNCLSPSSGRFSLDNALQISARIPALFKSKVREFNLVPMSTFVAGDCVRNHKPSEEQVAKHAAYLGIKDKDQFWIARNALEAPLPEGWGCWQTMYSRRIFYYNPSKGQSTRIHPCDQLQLDQLCTKN